VLGALPTKKGRRLMSGKELPYMTDEEMKEWRSSGLDKCPHPSHRTLKDGLKVCKTCNFIINDKF
jgi:hypothetical protein